jgi:hypothetical protein
MNTGILLLRLTLLTSGILRLALIIELLLFNFRHSAPGVKLSAFSSIKSALFIGPLGLMGI